MPRYYCDYCDNYLTHDSPSVRKQHNAGFKHKANVRAYYLQFEQQETEDMIEKKIAANMQLMQQFSRPGFIPGTNVPPAGLLRPGGMPAQSGLPPPPNLAPPPNTLRPPPGGGGMPGPSGYDMPSMGMPPGGPMGGPHVGGPPRGPYGPPQGGPMGGPQPGSRSGPPGHINPLPGPPRPTVFPGPR